MASSWYLLPLRAFSAAVCTAYYTAGAASGVWSGYYGTLLKYTFLGQLNKSRQAKAQLLLQMLLFPAQAMYWLAALIIAVGFMAPGLGVIRQGATSRKPSAAAAKHHKVAQYGASQKRHVPPPMPGMTADMGRGAQLHADGARNNIAASELSADQRPRSHLEISNTPGTAPPLVPTGMITSSMSPGDIPQKEEAKPGTITPPDTPTVQAATACMASPGSPGDASYATCGPDSTYQGSSGSSMDEVNGPPNGSYHAAAPGLQSLARRDDSDSSAVTPPPTPSADAPGQSGQGMRNNAASQLQYVPMMGQQQSIGLSSPSSEQLNYLPVSLGDEERGVVFGGTTSWTKSAVPGAAEGDLQAQQDQYSHSYPTFTKMTSSHPLESFSVENSRGSNVSGTISANRLAISPPPPPLMPAILDTAESPAQVVSFQLDDMREASTTSSHDGFDFMSAMPGAPPLEGTFELKPHFSRGRGVETPAAPPGPVLLSTQIPQPAAEQEHGAV